MKVFSDLVLAPVGWLGTQFGGKTLSWWIERVLLIMVVARFGLYLVETDVLMTANGRQSPAMFIWIERLIAMCFTIEYFVRWKNSSNPRKWPFRLTAIIDLLSFLPFWLGFFVPVEWLGFIRGCRTISLLKFYRYSPKAQHIFDEIVRMKKMLSQVSLINAILIVFFGSIMFEVERAAQPDKFTKVFDGIWYSVVTASTTGYGDLFPVTLMGRATGIALIFISIAFMSVYIGMFTTAALRAFKEELEENA